MSELITKEEINEIKNRRTIVSCEDILTGRALMLRPKVTTTRSGYEVSLTSEEFPGISIEHVAIRYGHDGLDIAAFDLIARDILGSEYVYVGTYTDTVYNYLKLVSGEKEVFDGFIKFMRKGVRT